MNTLTRTCFLEAFAGADSARAALDYADRFTSRFREVEELPPAMREAEMLAAQFPEVLLPCREGDLFAGRIRYGIVGLSPEPCGLGYYCGFAEMAEWMCKGAHLPGDVERAERLMAFWRGRTTSERVRDAYPPDVAATLPSDAWTEESGVAFPLYRMSGTVLDFTGLLGVGLCGLAERVRSSGSGLFHGACLAAIEVLRSSISHYIADAATPAAVRTTLAAIRDRAPRTFREAIQLFWLYALHAGTWNYGRLDVALGPFLARDLAAEVISDEEAGDLLCSLWKLIHAYNNQYNNRVIVGGRARPDEAAADRFALLAIEATRRLRLNQPQLSLRFHEGQNPLLWERALDAIGEGCTFPILYNDDVNIPAVAEAFGVDREMAASYTPFGCGEYVLSHFSQGTPSGVINLLKALEVAIRGGVDRCTGRRIPGVPDTADLRAFSDVWSAYARVVEHHVRALARQQKIEYDVLDAEAPLLFASMLTADCIERGKGLAGGGSRHLGGTLETYGNTNAADSLHAIEELVFRRKELPLGELVGALDRNFEGAEALRQRCLAVSKYGNDEGLADAMAVRVHEHICRATRNQAANVGLDSYLVVVINNWANTVLGWKTLASAEGRLAGQPMANGNNPTPGSDTSGPTAFLNSLTRLDPSMHAGAVQNMKFTKEWFRPDLRPKFEALLRAYFLSGGSQAMITVVSRDDLEAAMREPEKWGHLMVRVGGFSIRFVELPRDAQLEVLERTLH